MHKIVLTLEEDDLLALQAILLDEDEKEAMSFLKDRIAPRLPNKGTALCDSSRRNPYLLRDDEQGPKAGS